MVINIDNQTYNSIVNFIWSIADDCLRDVYVRSKYRDVILPMTVVRRLDESSFGYYKAMTLRPQYATDEPATPRRDKNGKLIPNKDLTDTEQISLDYPGGVDVFFKKEVLPYATDAWIDESKTQIGYEISFTKNFNKPVKLRELSEIIADIRALEAETEGLLKEVLAYEKKK